MRVGMLLLAVLVLAGCGKNKDDEPPTIQISQPAANAQFTAGESIAVVASVADNKALETLSITLVSQGLSPVHTTLNVDVSGTSHALSAEYDISTFDDPSDTYWLRIRATDGENTTNEYVELFVNGEPLQREGVILASESGGTTLIQTMDQNQSLQAVASVNSDLSGLGVDPASGQIIVAGEFTPEIRALNFADGLTAWSVTGLNNDPFPTYTGVQHFNGKSYVSERVGWVRGYDFNGNVQHTTEVDQAWYPEQSYLFDELLLVVERANSTQQMQLSAYWSFSGELAQRVDLPFDDVVGFANLDDQQIFVAGNEGGEGKLMLYHLNDNDFLTGHSMPSEPLLCLAELAPGIVVFGTASDLFWYDYSLTSMVALGTDGASRLAFDALNNELFAVQAATLRSYDAATRTQQYSVNSVAPIDEIAILYNR